MDDGPDTALDTAAVERACERLVLDSAAHNDSKDWAALAALYTPDARLERPSGQVVEGREAIEAAYRAGPADRQARHVCTNITITVGGPAEATGTTTVVLYAWTAPPPGETGDGELPTFPPPALGEFVDSFALTEQGWRISARQARLIARPDIGQSA